MSYVLAILLFVCVLAASAKLYSRNRTHAKEEMPNLESLTPMQRKLYQALTHRGHPIQLYQPCGRFTMDMVLPNHRIALECESELVSLLDYKQAHPSKKARYLNQNGWRVMRIQSSMIKGDIGKVIKRIEGAIEQIQAK